MKAIITFHNIGDDGSVLSFTAGRFAQLLDDFETFDIPVLTLDQLLDDSVDRGVALTFDDGMASVFDAALPVMRERKTAAHLFLTVGAVGGDNRWPSQPASAPIYKMLSWDQLHELHANGMQIEAHTFSHPDLRELSDDDIETEFARCDTEIEKRFGRRPAYFSYPYGFFDARVERICKARYAASVSTRLGYLGRSSRASALPRLDSYYLQSSGFVTNLFSMKTRQYLAVRATMRRVRGGIWNSDHA